MCGIAAFFARESVPDWEVLNTLFESTEKRGQDGFGIFIENRKTHLCTEQKWTETYSKCKDDVKDVIMSEIKIGSLVIAISRAAPETEPQSSINNLQPIHNSRCVVAHNGAVSNSIHQELKQWARNSSEYHFTTDIDSESIIAAYIKHNRNIKDAMEYLSGGFAAILFDRDRDSFYIINDFKPIAHCYIRGIGYFLASDNDVLGEIIESVSDCKRDGINLWENWYHHYLSGGRIKEVDLDSGFVRNIKYSPRYIIGDRWDSNHLRKEPKTPIEEADQEAFRAITPNMKYGKELCLVACSGGLDSSLTLAMLKKAGYENIIACHFSYGHRGEEAEEQAAFSVCHSLGVGCHKFNISDLMKGIDNTSMLTDPNAKVTTGTPQGLKQLDAWVNGRNMMFMTCMAAYAESQVMKYGYEKVYFLGGFLNLSESGHYPDNSEYFLDSCLNMFKYGTLIGDRIKPLYALSNLMKHELFVLIKEFGLEDMYRNTISCDRPICTDEHPDDDSVEPIPKNCSKNGMPACGSGLLSWWGAKMVDMDDMELRNFYEVEDDYTPHIPKHITDGFSKCPDVNDIIDRILLPADKIEKLKSVLSELKG